MKKKSLPNEKKSVSLQRRLVYPQGAYPTDKVTVTAENNDMQTDRYNTLMQREKYPPYHIVAV